jgi:arylsulfatase A-like enzyme
LSPYVGRVIGLELRAARATEGGRVAFGEPKLRRPVTTTREQRRATTVVILVAAGIDRHLLPPWAPIGENSAFGELLRDAVAFHAYRVPTTVPAGVLTSLLTGLSPTRHRVEDTAARLGTALHPLSQVVKQAGGRTAMFTAAPTSFAAFGFNVGWDDYGAFSPVLDIPAETPLVEASRWLSQRLDQNPSAPRLLLVHLRGAHPPWDITREQAAQLPPADYAGALEARRGGIILGKIRRQTAKVQRRLNDDDTERLAALMKAALVKQNGAIAALIATLKRRDAWDDTLFIVAGDVANAEPPSFPFEPTGSLREDQLTVPLLVKFPGRAHAGETFGRPVTTVDLTHTILDALQLNIPETVEGHSLMDALSGNEPLLTRTLISTLGQRYVARTGVWLLSGEFSGVPRLCQTDIDPMCVEDQFSRRPLSARALYQWTMKELATARRAAQKTQREPASIDADTAAALTVWGDVEM